MPVEREISRFSLIYIAEFITVLLSTFPQPFLYHYYGAITLPITAIIPYLGLAIELAFGDRFWRNYKILKLNGFTDSQLVFSAFFAVAFGNGGVYIATVLLYYFHGEAQPYFDLSLILKVLLMLVGSEIGFTISHFLLHTKLGHLHVMHHCCIHNSCASNFMFQPLDLVLEFGAPAGVVVAFNELFLQDHFATLCAIGTMYLWYAMDHDTFAQLPHSNHHKYINSLYTIYLNARTGNKDDMVVKLVKRVDPSHHVYDSNQSLTEDNQTKIN